MTWSKQAIDAVQTIYHQIMQHPFIVQLANGSLTQTRFNHYLEQDTLYLAEYRSILATIGAKCHNSSHQKQFLHFAMATIEAEQIVHQYFLKKSASLTYQTMPATALYTGYLYQQLTTQPLAVAVASILPCFYLYQQVGEALHQQQLASNHPYHAWISTYASEAFKQDVITVVNIADQLAADSMPDIQAQMTEAFLTAAKMEWLFWDGAWRLESWPI